MNSVLVIQHGDYAEAYDRFAAGGPETYREQLKSVRYVESLSRRMKIATAAFCGRRYHRKLADNLYAVGMDGTTGGRRGIRGLFEEFAPTHVVVCTPNVASFREASARKVRTLALFADTITPGRLRGRWHNWHLRRELNKPNVTAIGNHSLNASRSLVTVLGLPRERIVPWDREPVPLAGPVKDAPAVADGPSLLFVGALTAGKGVGDCLAALVELRRLGKAATFTFAGGGDIAQWTARAARLGLSDAVKFLGQVGTNEVMAEMCRHDIIVVPTRHDYQEGLPNTIREALASRTPMVISDHPAFVGRLSGDDCEIFPAGDPRALAASIARLSSDPARYHALSAGSEAARERLRFGLERLELMNLFIEDAENKTGWVERNSMARLDP